MNGDMALELNYQVLEQGSKSVRLGMACGTQCGAAMEVGEALAAEVGKGWQTKQILLRCLQSGADAGSLKFDHITAPLVLSADKGLKLQLAQVRIASNEGAAGCTL
jgi:beta-glucosidase